MNQNLQELSAFAISASLTQQWPQAIDLNLHIVQLDPQNISALNRLGKAYEETGELEKALKTYRKVLKIDKYNRIATNNLERLSTVKKLPKRTNSGPITYFSFIEEPGKTKTVSLTKLASPQAISLLRIAQQVNLKTNTRKVSVNSFDGDYIGYLPDDLSLHLIRLIKSGNKYEAAIKTVTKSNIEVFIRETKKSPKLKGLPSFPLKDTQKYYQFLPSDPISEVPLEITDSESDEIV